MRRDCCFSLASSSRAPSVQILARLLLGRPSRAVHRAECRHLTDARISSKAPALSRERPPVRSTAKLAQWTRSEPARRRVLDAVATIRRSTSPRQTCAAVAKRKRRSGRSTAKLLSPWTSCSSAPPTSTDCSIRDGAVVSLTAAAVLLLEQSGRHVDVAAWGVEEPHSAGSRRPMQTCLGCCTGISSATPRGLFGAARRTPAACRDRDAATYPDVARTRAATRLVGETCSWLNPIPGRPLPAAVFVWGSRPGNDDRAALKRHPLSRQRKLRECALVLGCCSHEVPLLGSQCGVGNGRRIAWTAHDDEFSSRDRSLAVAVQPVEGRRA